MRNNPLWPRSAGTRVLLRSHHASSLLHTLRHKDCSSRQAGATRYCCYYYSATRKPGVCTGISLFPCLAFFSQLAHPHTTHTIRLRSPLLSATAVHPHTPFITLSRVAPSTELRPVFSPIPSFHPSRHHSPPDNTSFSPSQVDSAIIHDVDSSTRYCRDRPASCDGSFHSPTRRGESALTQPLSVAASS
jgi:hypothetical protein